MGSVIYGRRLMKWFLYGFLSILLVGLNSCIDGEEEVFLHADGSGKLKVKYQVPGMFFTQAEADELVEIIEKEVGGNENLELLTNRVDTENGKKIIRIEVAAASVVELENMLEDHGDEGDGGSERSKTDKTLHTLMGDLKVKVSGLTAHVRRDVDLEQYLGERGTSFLRDSEFRYLVHLPKAAGHSNAHEVLNDGKTLKWVYKLRECGKKPISMEMQAPIPLPRWLYALVGGLVLLVVGVIFAFLRKSGKKSIA